MAGSRWILHFIRIIIGMTFLFIFLTKKNYRDNSLAILPPMIFVISPELYF